MDLPGLKSRCEQGGVPSGDCKGVFLACLSSRGFQFSLAYSHFHLQSQACGISDRVSIATSPTGQIQGKFSAFKGVCD